MAPIIWHYGALTNCNNMEIRVSKKVAIQMDHISGVNIVGDSSFAILLEGQKRGHQLFHYTPDQLTLHGSELIAPIQELNVEDVVGNHFNLGKPIRTHLTEMDVILLRQDPPFDMAYVSSTHLLENIQSDTLVVNDPVNVRNAPEKIFVMEFRDLMPETLITRDRNEIESFRSEFGDIVMKPLYGNGGAAVFMVSKDDINFGSLYDLFESMYREPWVVQRFIPEVEKGDKRIVLIDGEYAGAVNRIPNPGDLRSNMVRGASAIATNLSDRELEICERLKEPLKSRGLLFAGIDVINGCLTEINVTSPTGIRIIKELGGPDIAALMWDKIETKLRTN